MDKSAETSPIALAAYSFYQWFSGAPAEQQGSETIRRFLGADITLDELQRLEERVRNNAEFNARSRPVLERWRARVNSARALSEQEAQQLLEELFQSFDHALLYDRGITAGSTHILPARTSLGDKTFTGGMPCWTLHYTVAGSALFLSDSMEQQTQPGDLMLMKPGASYHYGLHPRGEEWLHLWALFQPRQHWPELLQWPTLDEGILYLSLSEGILRKRIEALFREVISMRNDNSPYCTDLQYNRLEEILIRARSVSAALAESHTDPRILKACEYMEARMASRLAVDDVAESCSLSPSRFAHLFKEQMGVGPKAWINDVRLQRARKLLLAGDDSINTIGARVGFDDPGHFTRHFKKSVGCSPRQFRQSFSR